MEFSTGFYTDECQIYYYCNIEDDKKINEETFKQPEVNFFDTKKYDFKSSFVGLVYIYAGELTVHHCEQFITIPEKTLLVCSPDYPLKFIKSITNTELVSIRFHTSIINTYKKPNNLFKIFYTEKIEERLYTPQMHSTNIIVPLFNSIKAIVLQHYNEPFVYSRISTIITELNIIYERCFEKSEKEIPNVTAKIIDYIERHYTEKLTIEFLCEKFFISPSTIHRICKKSFGKTFKEKIAEMRLREARALMQKKNILPSKAAEICGYDDYSSFYRAYKKAFGVSPAKDVVNKQNWPLQ